MQSCIMSFTQLFEIELHNYLVIYMPNLNNANQILTNCKNHMNAECF